MRKYISGKSQPGLDKLISKAGCAGVSVQWLATGQEASNPSSELAAFPTSYLFFQSQEHSETLDHGFFEVPYYSVCASAGNGLVVDSEEKGGSLAFTREWLHNYLRVSHKDLQMLDVEGDSMEPTLRNGGMILINRSDTRIRCKISETSGSCPLLVI